MKRREMSYTPILFRTSTFIELDVSTRCGSVDNVRTAEPQNRRYGLFGALANNLATFFNPSVNGFVEKFGIRR